MTGVNNWMACAQGFSAERPEANIIELSSRRDAAARSWLICAAHVFSFETGLEKTRAASKGSKQPVPVALPVILFRDCWTFRTFSHRTSGLFSGAMAGGRGRSREFCLGRRSVARRLSVGGFQQWSAAVQRL